MQHDLLTGIVDECLLDYMMDKYHVLLTYPVTFLMLRKIRQAKIQQTMMQQML